LVASKESVSMGGQDVEIRCISECLDAVPTIAGWHFAEWGHEDPTGSLESWTAGLEERVHPDRIPTTYVALEGEMPIASAVLVEHDMDIRRDLTPWLAGVFVLQRARRRGIAAALVSHTMTAARGFGVETLYLYTNSAEGLYAKLGWQPIGEEFYEGRNVTVMSAVLR
jgi:GNAT superfamily N-acetyltransferase